EELYISNQGRGPVDCYYMTANNAEIRCYGSGYVDAFVIGTANIYGEYGRECARIYGTRYIVYYDE
ncbi:MAG: hypothetical protein HUK15_05515, partial [Bacteroidales bacterium]|nr:hypothetical protein [Bacteroidales bacterium]